MLGQRDSSMNGAHAKAAVVDVSRTLWGALERAVDKRILDYDCTVPVLALVNLTLAHVESVESPNR